MTNRFGGVPIEASFQNRWGGVPVEDEDNSPIASVAPLPMAAPVSQATQANYPMSGIIEPVAAIGSGMAAEVAGGLSVLPGMIASGPGEQSFDALRSGVEMQEGVREAMTFQPRTEAGQKSMAILGDLVAKGIDIVNFPLSGLTGLGELIAGQGVDRAVETIQEVQGEKGLGETLGDRAADAGVGPVGAGLIESAPQVIAELAGMKGTTAGIQRTLGAAEKAGGVVGKALEAPLDVMGDIGAALLPPQFGFKQQMAKMLEDGTVDPDSAVWEIREPNTIVGEVLSPSTPRVTKSKTAKAAITQGFDPAVVATIKAGTPEDLKAFKDMTVIMEKGKKNNRYAIENRPGNVPGDLLLDRVKVVMKANREAGQKLDKVAGQLRGHSVDTADATGTFINELKGMGIKLAQSPEGKVTPRFIGSDIQELTAPMNAVKRMINRMMGVDLTNAYEVHRLKRFIDEQVSYGKVGEGLTGQTERVLKTLRHNLDKALDETFPKYDAVNLDYSVTKSGIDELQEAIGRKKDLKGPNADKALGQVLRRLMSNADSRVALLDSVNNIDVLAKKYGGKDLKGDLFAQILYADELDKVFGPVARTSFQGQIGQAVSRGAEAVSSPGMAALKAGGEMAAKARGINQEGAFTAINDLLNDLENRKK